MVSQQELVVWKERWDSLNGIVNGLIPWYQTLAGYGSLQFPRLLTLYQLVKRLQAFASDQFDFFYDGLGEQQHHNLIASNNYPREYVLSVTLDQIAHDLEIIQRAKDQRTSGTDEMRRVLDKADKLAWKALQPVVSTEDESRLVKKGTTVVTYFQKSPSIRVIPYAPVALIGIPFTCIAFARDYLAIPHEVGHYVYWHGSKVGGEPIYATLSKALEGSSPETLKVSAWCYRWREEIFADVYGCLIGGPVMALDFQDLQLECSLKKFTEDDEEHPVPVVRPDAYTKVLERMGNFPIALSKLKQNWNACKGKRDNPLEFKVRDNQSISITTARGEMDKVIEEVLNLLSITPSPELEDLAQEEDIGKLYENFVGTLDNSISGIKLPKLEELERPWTEWVAEFFDGEPPFSIESEPEHGDEPGWIHVLDAHGWATKGPQSRIY